jgi:putative membrane-bound dehydrogenase-like protein
MNRSSFPAIAISIVVALVSLGADDPKTPIPPAGAVAAMRVPEGLSVSLFAAEPDVRQPIAFCIDDRGRLWVSYPKWSPAGKDRISVFEDTDGDGKFDKKTIFYDKLNYVSGVRVGFGGVWVTSAPHLLFIPDKDGDDIPDDTPEIHLDGWGTTGVHNIVNSLNWGPDGWLYGCNGITAPSKVGRPGTPEKERIEMNCGIWRYHPTRQIFELHAEGTTNPWGLDYDERGQFFMSNNVLPHLFHVIQGAHYIRMFGNDFNPYVYGQIGTIADHLHWGGGEWTTSRGGEGAHGVAGGGHSHSAIRCPPNTAGRHSCTISMATASITIRSNARTRDTSPGTARIFSWPGTNGSGASLCITGRTARCIFPTGRTPANATSTTPIFPTDGSIGSPSKTTNRSR